MVNNTQNNEGICFIECENQISNNHSSLNTHFKTLQNPFTNLKNYNQGIDLFLMVFEMYTPYK